MKERFKNVVKWFLIVLGILFLLQTILLLGFILGIAGLSKADFSNFGFNDNAKPFTNIIKYIDDYRQTQGKYPQDINSIKKDKNYDYTYTPNSDNSCYTLEAKSKKDSKLKRFQRCFAQSQDSTSSSQSYVEFYAK